MPLLFFTLFYLSKNMIMYAYQLVRKNSDIFKLSILFYLYSRMKISIAVCIANNYVFDIWWHLIPETFYWFGDNNYTEWEELFKQYNPPPYKLPRMTGAYSFGVAGIEKCKGTSMVIISKEFV